MYDEVRWSCEAFRSDGKFRKSEKMWRSGKCGLLISSRALSGDGISRRGGREGSVGQERQYDRDGGG